jgi:hypothetical protein
MEEAHTTPWTSMCQGANASELRISNVERGGLLSAARWSFLFGFDYGFRTNDSDGPRK